MNRVNKHSVVNKKRQSAADSINAHGPSKATQEKGTNYILHSTSKLANYYHRIMRAITPMVKCELRGKEFLVLFWRRCKIWLWYFLMQGDSELRHPDRRSSASVWMQTGTGERRLPSVDVRLKPVPLYSRSAKPRSGRAVYWFRSKQDSSDQCWLRPEAAERKLKCWTLIWSQLTAAIKSQADAFWRERFPPSRRGYGVTAADIETWPASHVRNGWKWLNKVRTERCDQS